MIVGEVNGMDTITTRIMEIRAVATVVIQDADLTMTQISRDFKILKYSSIVKNWFVNY